MRHLINIRLVYSIEQSVFNVGENGTKTIFDPVTKTRFAFGSSANVKHCIKEAFYDNFDQDLHIKEPVRHFVKKVKNAGTDKNEQGGVYTEINDLKNLSAPINGSWNSILKNGLYENLKASYNVGNFTPIHPFLSDLHKDSGANVGNSDSVIEFENGKKGKEQKIYKTPEEVAKDYKMSNEEATKMFNEATPMNFVKTNDTGTGIYSLDIVIDMDAFAKYNLSKINTIPEEKMNELLAAGWTKRVINRQEYLIPTKEEIKEVFEGFINALFTWDFRSNNSLNGTPKKFLRACFAVNNSNVWQVCTTSEIIDEEDRKAQLVIYENIDGVYSFNSPVIKSVPFVAKDAEDNVITPETNLNAAQKAEEELVKIGFELIEKI